MMIATWHIMKHLSFKVISNRLYQWTRGVHSKEELCTQNQSNVNKGLLVKGRSCSFFLPLSKAHYLP